MTLMMSSRATAGAWTLPKGRLWTKAALFFQSTDEQFCSGNLAFCDRHDRAPFSPFTGGRSRSIIVFTEAEYGLTDRLTFGVQVPFYSLEFRDLSNPNRPKTQKIGDIRFYARYRLLLRPVVASVRFGAKSPTGGVDVDAEVVPVGEGQWDFETFVDAGRSISIFPGYANISLGYRLRTTNRDFDFRPGDEISIRAEGGWRITPQLMGKGVVSYLYSRHPAALGITFTRQRRELLAVTPGILYTPHGTLTFETGVSIPVTGQDLPAGPQLNTGVSYSFDLFSGRRP